METPVPAVVLEDDSEGRVLLGLDVLAWRYHCLEQAGFPVDIAIELSQLPGVDLHVACRLLHEGATVEQAVRILT